MGSYMMLLLFQVSLVISTMFITANAVHGLTILFARSILNVEITWMQWAAARFPPGLILLAIVLWAVYKLYPPTVKEMDNKIIADEGLRTLGPMTIKEKYYFLFSF
jgi:DASS family divalent anion:Na+ symporter